VRDCGADEIALSDTIGVATPSQVEKIVEMSSSIFPLEKTVLHFHNTYGLALANIAAAIKKGIRQFDGSMGGIGGCPYAKGASGNMATEDIAYFLERAELSEKYDWEAISQVIDGLEKLGLPTNSHISSVIKKGGTLYGIS
jgi:hydroxymethylglutaryl-CoA lyase